MAKRRIEISNLNIRLPRVSEAESRALAANIGREILKSIAGASGVESGNIKLGGISVGGIKMSDGVAGQTGARVAAEVGRQIKNGGRR